MLEIKNLTVRYGGITAVKDISLTIGDRESVSLIGANGAGKTTTLHAISALLRPASGRIFFDGTDITGIGAEKIVGMGIVQVPEGRQLFTKLTVEDNLRMGAYQQKDKAEIRRLMDRAMTCSRWCGSAAGSWPARSRAANSRWWLSAAR